jgi:hypothetical protein
LFQGLEEVCVIADLYMCNGWFENVAQFRYLGTAITNQNLMDGVDWVYVAQDRDQ